jgi:hypothetical protein
MKGLLLRSSVKSLWRHQSDGMTSEIFTLDRNLVNNDEVAQYNTMSSVL